jgi:hypothetical protein
MKARQWLVEHGAIQKVENYIRPLWRKLDKERLTQLQNLDQSFYGRPMGILRIDDQEYPLLYTPQRESSDIERHGVETMPDSKPGLPSTPLHMQRGLPELDSSKEELDANKEKDSTPPVGAVETDASELTLSNTLIDRWQSALDKMVVFPDAEFHAKRQRAIRYLALLLERDLITVDDDWKTVLSVVKREALVPDETPTKERQPNPWYDAVETDASETEGDSIQSDWNPYIIATMVEWVNTPFYHDMEKADAYLDDLWKQQKISGYAHSDDILAIVKREVFTKSPTPRAKRPANSWYDAVAAVFDLHGGRNGLMAGLLQGKATKNGHKDYNLPEPLTSAEDVLKFGRWWKANHDGLTMVQSPIKVQSEVMGWQAKGCPDAEAEPKTKREIALERLAQGLPYAY